MLHAQMTRPMVMAMSDVRDQIELAAPLTFMVIDDKGGERLIKASRFLFHLLIFVPKDMYYRL